MSKMFFTFKWGASKYVTKEDLEKVLLNYYTKEEVDALLKKYATIEDIAGELATKLDTVEFEQFKEHLQSELDEKAEQTWVEQEVQRLEDEIANIPKPDLSNYATLNGNNRFDGNNEFWGDFTYNGRKMTVNAKAQFTFGLTTTIDRIENDDDVTNKQYVDNAISSIPPSGAKLAKIRIAKPIGIVPTTDVEAGLSSFIALAKGSVGIIRKDGEVIDTTVFFELLKTKQTFARILMNNAEGGEYTSVISHMITTDGDNLILNFTNYSKTKKSVYYSKTIEFYMLDN